MAAAAVGEKLAGGKRSVLAQLLALTRGSSSSVNANALERGSLSEGVEAEQEKKESATRPVCFVAQEQRSNVVSAKHGSANKERELASLSNVQDASDGVAASLLHVPTTGSAENNEVSRNITESQCLLFAGGASAQAALQWLQERRGQALPDKLLAQLNQWSDVVAVPTRSTIRRLVQDHEITVPRGQRDAIDSCGDFTPVRNHFVKAIAAAKKRERSFAEAK